MKSGIRIGSKGKHKAKGEQNIKVLLKLFQKLAKGRGEIPPLRGGNVAQRQRGTARVAGEEPPISQKEREAFPPER